MEQTRLDDRGWVENGRIRLKNGAALNGNLSQTIPEFPDDASVSQMREATGELGLNKIREAAKRRF